MKRSCWVALLLLAAWRASLAQDSLAMRRVSGLDYWLNGVDDIQMVGDTAYVTAGPSGLHIVSLADPAHPLEIGSYPWYSWWNAAGGVYACRNRAYLGTANGGMVLDISDPTQPVLLGQWNSGGMEGVSFATDTYAIGQAEEGYPYVLDVTNPQNVHLLSDLPGLGGQGRAIGVAGEYLCIAARPGGLQIYDMNDPAHPQNVASVDAALSSSGGMVSGNYVYLETMFNGLRIIDVSDPLHPLEVAVCDTTGNGGGFDVTVLGSHAIIRRDGWLDIWDVSDPMQPVIAGTWSWDMSQEWGSCLRIVGGANHVCLPDLGVANAVAVLDMSEPASPVQVSSFGPRGDLTRITLQGSTVFLIDQFRAFITVGFADPSHLVDLAHTGGIGRNGYEMAVTGNYAYLAEGHDNSGSNSMAVYNINDPAAPELLGYVLPHGLGRLAACGSYLYAVTNSQLCTFGLANPAAPQLLNSQPLAVGGYGPLQVSNGVLYYGSNNMIAAYSLSDSTTPHLDGTCTLQGGDWIYDFAVVGSHIYVADGQGGLRILTTGLTEVNAIGGMFWAAGASGNILIVKNATQVAALDLTDPLHPQEVAYYTTPEWLQDLKVQAPYIFTISETHLQVYQCDALEAAHSQKGHPYEFALQPCYPNPFNSTTVVAFSLPKTERTKLIVYDVTGRETKVLEDRMLSAGDHQVTFDGSALASGVYFAQLKAGKNVQTEKLMLLK